MVGPPLGDDETSQLSPIDRGVLVGMPPVPSELPLLSAFGILPCIVVLLLSSADSMHPVGDDEASQMSPSDRCLRRVSLEYQ